MSTVANVIQRHHGWILTALIALQLGAIAKTVVRFENVILHGQRIQLITTPVDPVDLFRGEYVQLNYAMNRAPVSMISPALQQRSLRRDEVVFATLKPAQNSTWVLDKVEEKSSPDAVYLRARVDSDRHAGDKEDLQLRFGLERFYVEQGQAQSYEGREDDGSTTSLKTTVAVDSDGYASVISIERLR